MMLADDDDNARVTVSVRVRPKLSASANQLQSNERYAQLACTATSETTLKLWDGKPAKDSRNYHFSYDHIFDTETAQEELYEETTVDAVDCVLAGTNASVLAYGQTGSGKTYTILGGIDSGHHAVANNTGLLMRSIEELLTYSRRVASKRHVVIGISVVEIYLDEVRDLLNPASTSGTRIDVALIKDIVRLPDLTWLPLSLLADAVKVYQLAAAKRVQRATSANDTSSRSHAVFSIEVYQTPNTRANPKPPTLADCVAMRDSFVVTSLSSQNVPKPVRSSFFAGASNPLMGTNEVPVMYSKLTVADLAGSEKAKHSDVRGEGFDELRKINSSLTALGNVVRNLFERSKHIPYRDSKLTMILRDSFAAPFARIALIVNVSPTVLTVDETLSSLYFADKVKSMKVDSVRQDPREAALEEAYLRSLQTHDALLADLRICACEQEKECVSFLPVSASLQRENCPLMLSHTHTHVTSRSNTGKATAMEALVSHLRRVEASEGGAEVRLRRVLEKERAAVISETVAAYHDNRTSVSERIDREQERCQALRKQAEAETASMMAALAKTKEKGVAAVEARRDQARCKERTVAALMASKETMLAIESESKTLSRELGLQNAQWENQESAASAQDEEWLRVSYIAQQAVSATETRAAWVQERQLAVRAMAEKAACKKNTRARTRDMTVEEWLRHSVLAMAGNAVVQSTRRQARRGRTKDPTALQSLENFNSVGENPKYWALRSHGVLDRNLASHMSGKRSTFDNPSLGSIVLSYMEMGAHLHKADHAGCPQPRLFYVKRRTDGPTRLCWEDSTRGMGLGNARHIDVTSIEHILLGQFVDATKSTSTDGKGSRKDKDSKRDNEDAAGGGTAEDVFHRSFALVHRVGSNSKKALHIRCSTMAEMETWVIGLSNLSGVLPAYPSQQELGDTVAEAPDEEELAALPHDERAFCRQWHIPAHTFVNTKSELTSRYGRTTKDTGRPLSHKSHSAADGGTSEAVRVTPGELRDLTRLDIFRASALWLSFNTQGLVQNHRHLRHLYCYVQDYRKDSGSTPCSLVSPI